MLPLSKVQDLISKHSRLEKELSSQEIDKKTFADIVRPEKMINPTN